MNTITDPSNYWIGTAEVDPLNGNKTLGTATGAYVSVLGIANNEAEFQARVEHVLNELEFERIEIDDLKRFCGERFSRS